MDLSDKLYVKSLTIEGFGRFQEATTIELAPVTFLIGPNGAGKSTVAKVLMLLQEVFAKGAVPVENRYRSAPGTCKVWWTYQDELAPTEVGFGVKLKYGSTPSIESYLLMHEGKVALEWEEKMNDDPPFWLQRSIVFDEENEPVAFGFHASCIGPPQENVHARLHDRTVRYVQSDANKIVTAIDALLHSDNKFSVDWNNLTAINSACITAEAELTSNERPHIALLTSRLDVLDGNWSNPVEEYLTDIYTPSDLVAIKAAFGGSISIDSLQNTGQLDQALCIEATGKFLKTTDTNEVVDALDELAKYAVTKALLTVAIRPGIFAMKEFVAAFSKEMPVRLASDLRDFVPLHDERPIERALRIFANQWDAFELTQYMEDYDYNLYQLITSKKEFFSTLDQFGAVDIKTPPAGTQAYQFMLELESGNMVDIKDMGTGFRAILCIYAWQLSGLKSPEIAISNIELIAPIEDETELCNKATGIRVKDFDSLYLEEIESALHPSAQTQLFTLIVKAQPLHPGTMYADDVSEGFSLVPQTEEEKLESKRQWEEAVAAAPAQRARDQLVPRRPLIFETHSEYIIRTALNMVASGEYPPDYFAINYIHAPALQPEGEEAAYRIPIRSNGTLAKQFGPGFFDEAQRLKLELLDLNRVQTNQAN